MRLRPLKGEKPRDSSGLQLAHTGFSILRTSKPQVQLPSCPQRSQCEDITTNPGLSLLSSSTLPCCACGSARRAHSSSSILLVLIHCILILILILMLIFNRCLDETYVFRTVFGNRSTYAIPWPVAPLPRPCRDVNRLAGPQVCTGQKSKNCAPAAHVSHA